MPRIIDLADSSDRPDILTRRSVNDGLFGGGQILNDGPLGSYLRDREDPRYVLRNKSAGVEIAEDTGTERLEPGADYQAVGLVTDVRVVFVAGRDGGDEAAELHLSEIVEAKATEEGFRTNALALATAADERWVFKCKDDVSAVATEVDEMAQVWANALRLLGEVDEQVSAAEAATDAGDFEAAREGLADAKGTLETALGRIEEVGPGAAAELQTRAEDVADDVRAILRELAADEGASAHARAQRAWGEQAYESAAREYERAIDAYGKALSTRGPRPDDDTLTRRRDGAIRERELLRVGPLVDADTARRRALAEEDPELAAEAWEVALDGYRELLSLDWGKETREFVVDRDQIRTQTVEIADDAIEDHLLAGRQWIHAGDRLALDGHEEQAREVYERARGQFEHAARLAREVRPEQLDRPDEAIRVAESRLSGTIPTELDEQPDIDTVVIAGEGSMKGETPGDEGDPAATARGASGDEASSGAGGVERAEARDDPRGSPPVDGEDGSRAGNDRSDASGADDAVDSAGSADRPEPATEDDPVSSLERESSSGEPSVLDQIRSRKRRDSGSVGDDEPASDTPRRSRTGTPEPEADVDGFDPSRPPHDGSTGEPDGDSSAPDAIDDDSLVTALFDLGEAEFDRLVADVWEAQGWSTTTFSVDVPSAYDVVATREEPDDERVDIWTIHRPGRSLETSAVRDCVRGRDHSQGADAAVIVTTGRPTTVATARAEAENVTVVDAAELASLVTFEGLEDHLRSLADQK